MSLNSWIGYELDLEQSASDGAHTGNDKLGDGISHRAGLCGDDLHGERPDGRGFLFRSADNNDKRDSVAGPRAEHRGRGHDKEPRWHRC